MLRIAFCGPHLDLNRDLAEEAKNLVASFADPFVMRHPLEEIIEFTRDQEWAKDIDWLALNTNVWRSLVQIKYQNSDCVISPSCGIDNVAMSAAWLAKQAKIIQMKGTLLGADGQPMTTHDHVVLNRTGSILQSILNQAEEEAVEYWDFIYAVYPLTSSSNSIDAELLEQYQDFIQNVPAFDKVEGLPVNKTAALDFLQKEVEKWQSLYNSQ